MTPARQPEAFRHPIRVVVRRTGISAHLLRAWERRYAAVVPERSETGRRLYSDADIERLILLKRAAGSGRSIGQVAALTVVDLARLVDEDDASAPTSPSGLSAPHGTTEDLVTRCLRFVEQFDAPNLRSALKTATLTMPLERLINNVLAPLLGMIGDRWREGLLGISQEHLATMTIESFLADTMRVSGSPGASGIVVTTPVGQQHRIGALLAAATAVVAGWRVVFLGADIPAVDIADAAVRTRASAVALSLVSTAHDPDLPAELTRLRSLLPKRVALFIGGAGVGAYEELLEKIGADVPADLESFRSRLESLAAPKT